MVHSCFQIRYHDLNEGARLYFLLLFTLLLNHWKIKKKSHFTISYKLFVEEEVNFGFKLPRQMQSRDN